MGKVFVVSEFWTGNPESRDLDWALNHFQKDEPKIIITYLNIQNHDKAIFNNRAQNDYLPKCRARKFQAEMLIPQINGTDKVGIELIKKHGMRKLVCDIVWKRVVYELFDNNPNLSCTVWFVQSNGELDSMSEFGPYALQNAQMEIEHLKRIVDEETTRRQKIQMEVEKLKKTIDEEMFKLQKAQKEVENVISQNFRNLF